MNIWNALAVPIIIRVIFVWCLVSFGTSSIVNSGGNEKH